jgi:hypothetical protein
MKKRYEMTCFVAFCALFWYYDISALWKRLSQKSRMETLENFVGCIMISRKYVIILSVTAVCISAMLLLGVGARQFAAVNKQSPSGQVLPDQDASNRSHKPRRFGKIMVPAEVSVDLADSSRPGGPVMIVVSASSQIPVSSGTITLKIPQIGEITAEKVVLWSGAPSDFVAETAEFVVDVLPEGEYHFAAIFEFTPDSENAGELFTSRALYLDVRPDKILSSNVSFDQIKRIELWNELEQRVRTELRTNTRYISPQVAEPLDKDIIARRIAQLRASDPDIARRIMELNRVKTVQSGESESIEQGAQSQKDLQRMRLRNRPVSERAVPIPDRYRDL